MPGGEFRCYEEGGRPAFAYGNGLRGGQLLQPPAVAKIARLQHDYFAPGALGSVYQEVVRFPQFKQTT